MQADEFEKNIQNKMEGFGLVPNDEVWKQVSIRIKKEKKKRKVAFFWLFTVLVLIAGTSALYVINNEINRKIVINEVKHNEPRQADNKIKLTTPYSSAHSYKAKAKTEKGLKLIKRGNIKRMPRSEIKNNVFTKITSAKVINNRLNTNVEKDNRKVYKQNKQIFKSLPPHKFYKPEETKTKVDTTLKNSIDGKTNLRKDTSAHIIVKEIRAKKQINKKWNFGFSGYSGISDNVSNLLESQNKSLLDSYSPISSGNTGYLNSNVNAVSNFKRGFSFGLGIFLKKQFTKRISLSAGIDYHLYNVKSAVGSRVNQQVSFYDSYLQNSTSVDGYFTIGDSSNYTFTNSENYSNNYHFVQLPVNFGYQINKNQEKPILISAGITPGYLLGTNALYANPSARVLYIDKEKFYHFQLSAQSSFLFPVAASHKFNLSAGPMIQYGLINATKAVTGNSQHLVFAGIKVNISL